MWNCVEIRKIVAREIKQCTCDGTLYPIFQLNVSALRKRTK